MHISYYAGQEQSGGAVTPAEILAFVTGAVRIPPMGFSKSPTICFNADKTQLLPTASTCALVLWLPLALQEYEEFKEKFDYAVQNTIGVGILLLCVVLCCWFCPLKGHSLFLNIRKPTSAVVISQ